MCRPFFIMKSGGRGFVVLLFLIGVRYPSSTLLFIFSPRRRRLLLYSSISLDKGVPGDELHSFAMEIQLKNSLLYDSSGTKDAPLRVNIATRSLSLNIYMTKSPIRHAWFTLLASWYRSIPRLCARYINSTDVYKATTREPREEKNTHTHTTKHQ